MYAVPCIFLCLLSPLLGTGAALASSSVYYPSCSECMPCLASSYVRYPLCSERVSRLHLLLSIIPYAQNGCRACIFFCLLSPMLRTGAALASSYVRYPLCSERVPRLHLLMSIIPFAQNVCRALHLLMSIIPYAQNGYRACIFLSLLSPMLRIRAAPCSFYLLSHQLRNCPMVWFAIIDLTHNHYDGI